MQARNLLLLILPLALTACATATPYQPAAKGLGYTEQKLESNRYRVTFSGNSATPRETVENYLMVRAAEITLQNGYDYFVLADRDTQADPQRQNDTGSSVGFGFGSGGGFGSGISLGIGTVLGGGSGEAYSASADVLVYKGRKPADNQKAFDAREVKANLDPQVKRPPAKTP